MQFRRLLFCLSLFPFTLFAQRTRSLEALATALVGSYTSALQASEDSTYLNIELEMVRIWSKRKDGVWLYVEQASAKSKEKPYRQRVYHVQEVNDSTFTSDILTIKSGEALFGAYKDPLLLDQLRMDSVDVLEGCTITLHKQGNSYVGSTEGRACSNAWGKATYATSEVTISPGSMVSWDRGYNEAGEQVWGAEKGGYRFVKRR